jgi:hypothetical protein
MSIVHNLKLDKSTLELISEEYSKALSVREWQFRLRGYGLIIKEMGDRKVVAKLRTGNILGVLPAQFA